MTTKNSHWLRRPSVSWPGRDWHTVTRVSPPLPAQVSAKMVLGLLPCRITAHDHHSPHLFAVRVTVICHCEAVGSSLLLSWGYALLLQITSLWWVFLAIRPWWIFPTHTCSTWRSEPCLPGKHDVVSDFLLRYPEARAHPDEVDKEQDAIATAATLDFSGYATLDKELDIQVAIEDPIYQLLVGKVTNSNWGSHWS